MDSASRAARIDAALTLAVESGKDAGVYETAVEQLLSALESESVANRLFGNVASTPTEPVLKRADLFLMARWQGLRDPQLKERARAWLAQRYPGDTRFLQSE